MRERENTKDRWVGSRIRTAEDNRRVGGARSDSGRGDLKWSPLAHSYYARKAPSQARSQTSHQSFEVDNGYEGKNDNRRQ